MKTKLNAILSLVLIFAVALGCSSTDETQKANKLVADGNESFNEAKKNAEDGFAKVYKMEAMLPRIKSQADLLAARSVANESISILNKAKDKYIEASNKFAEADKLSIHEKFKEYLDLKSQEMKKRSDAMDAIMGEPQALIQTESVSEYQFKVRSIADNFKNLLQSADELAKKADKIQEENKDAIKGKI
jgi:hypothetical protein